MKIIDSHQHIWDLSRFPYAWCRDIPALNQSFSIDDYRKASAGMGVEGAIFVEGDVDAPHQIDEARSIQTIADRDPFILGIVAGCRPESPHFVSQLDQFKELDLVKGVRRVLHTVPDEVSQADLFAENVCRLTDYQLSFDLCVLARQLPLAISLVEKCPNVSFILDHCGVPEIGSGAFDPWYAHIKMLAGFPNVVCKISGLVAYARPGCWTAEFLRPWTDHVIECFGWQRILWGGDWPVCTLMASLSQWMETARLLVRQASIDRQRALFFENAKRIYRLESR